MTGPVDKIGEALNWLIVAGYLLAWITVAFQSIDWRRGGNHRFALIMLAIAMMLYGTLRLLWGFDIFVRWIAIAANFSLIAYALTYAWISHRGKGYVEGLKRRIAELESERGK